MAGETTTLAWHEANQRHLVAAIERVRGMLPGGFGHDESRPQTPDIEATPSLEGDLPMALDSLSAAFGLSSFERNILVLCAGVELDSSFAEACRQATGFGGRPGATFGLALSVLPDAHWSALSPSAPLRSWRLIELADGEALVDSRLRIDEWALNYLTGVPHLDGRLEPLLHDVAPPSSIAPSHVEIARHLADQIVASEPGAAVQLCGAGTIERQAIAAAACAILGARLYSLDAADLPASASEREALCRLLEREAMLGGAIVLLEWQEETERPARALLESARFPLIVAGREYLSDTRRAPTRLDVPPVPWPEQRDLWIDALDGLDVEAEVVDRLLSQFRLGAGAIEAVAQTERAQPEPASAAEREQRLWDACRLQAQPGLLDLAQRIPSRATWDDLVLPAAQTEILRDITAHVRQRHTVYETWQFGLQSTRGLGISALFAGPSGTGKTMAGEVIANALDLDLYRIDLSQVVSKYIGETEKNLRRVFDAAEAGGAILLFDEADALFGKRTEVRDSHDRYANIEVSYLLQRMEDYRGLAILTTNMKSAMDAAFLRRLRFVVQFPYPEADQRAEIWRRVFPPQVPTSELDPRKLARLNLAGGNIRNIALHAAFLAADEGRCLGMPHLLRAARAEFTKLERPISEAEVEGWVT